MSGSGTSLVSLYIPSGSRIHDYNNLIKHELSTANNIKSKKVKNNVQSALKSIQQRLKLHKTVPENGLAIFAGEIESCI